MTKCMRNDCEAEAKGGVGIEIYPPAAVMNFYATNEPLSRLTLSLEVCDEHLAEIKPEAMFPEGHLEAIAQAVERGSGTAVDRNGCKVVRVAYDEPDWLTLKRNQAASG